MSNTGFLIEDYYGRNQSLDWPRVRAKHFLREIDARSETGDEEVLGLSGSRGVLRRSDMGQRASEASSYVGYKHVREGQLISNKMQAWNGMFGISPYNGITSPDYAVYEFSDQVVPRFIEYLCRTTLYAAEFHCRSKGMGTGFLRLNPREFLSTELWLPSIDIQLLIADFLDRETARIEQLIEKKRLFVTGVARRIEALVDQAIADANVPRTRFEHLTQRVSRPVTLSEHDELVRLGLYNRGRGIFRKPAADEEGMGDSEFFFVEAGDLILSGQFAWEGAVALATADEEGCVVSHRYPVYRGKSGVNTSYLLGLLRSSYGDFLLNEASRGSAGRNRPLNVRRLGKEKIPVPGSALQKAVEQAVDFERRLKGKTEQSIARLGEFRAALITAALTGQIDVATWGRLGETQRRLDKIGEVIQA
ncbi:restriction endonuclease subunit S [Stakelama pacifica]|uniref:Type I restriction enzyme S subunit n=1 Tax=Stakelama pacifica TaxID=517720 RepID=A0A4R6FX42_9SPHN|nr:restriction endonuclease subunit S [Stakelama pacifica]TDN86472.1 type I restriction enzyme S subunit [Stakelama pacifica]